MTLATARLRLAAVAAAHRLGGHEDPTSRPVVKATMKRLAREYGKPRRKETEAQAAIRALVDLALLDAAVAAAYGLSVDLTDEEVLEHLLALNYHRARLF